ncbi:alanine-phosphoribitol ligase [Kutzneria viridogrisea]|uniref:Styrene monooxygenase StyA putative substrate binding domain-containing protein n=1 Tax=Kutzneria viridogrisea TaxID=47990 RepID=A0ABR6BVN2_9PSEU|nr:hypothetical protein [Kutzneria viridogrisea]
MAHRILVVGAGQAGLTFALLALRAGHEVTVATDRSPEQVAAGPPMSTQLQWSPSLAVEREHGLDHWQDKAPQVTHLAAAVRGRTPMAWRGALAAPAQSVDQRVKFPRLMGEVDEHPRGRLHVGPLGVAAVDALALRLRSDLVVVTAGRGELGALFPVRAEHTPHSAPQRQLALVYLADEVVDTAACAAIPPYGEVFTVPLWSADGPARGLMIEAYVGGPWDVFRGITDPVELRARMLGLLRESAPAEHDRVRSLPLTDPTAGLSGAVVPRVAHPVTTLPSGRLVWGLGDVVARSDPLSGQGANSAVHMAAHYVEALGDDLSAPRLTSVFDAYWDRYGHAAAQFGHAITAPSQPHVRRVMAAAVRHPEAAAMLARSYERPDVAMTWMGSPSRTDELLAGLT